MILALMLPMAPEVFGPPLPTAAQSRSAIWADVRLNAWIGNGNRLVSLQWAVGHDLNHPPTLKITELNCVADQGGARCKFNLLRSPDAEATPEDRAEPTQLICEARLVLKRDDDGQPTWGVEHKPPAPGGGHSRTTMTCRRAD